MSAINRIIGLFLVLLVIPSVGSTGQPIQQSLVPPPVTFDHFKFDAVPDGTVLPHKFILHNNSETPLQILKVSTSCSCVSLEAFDKEIPSGDSGSISVKVNTTGYGGKVLLRKVTAFTNHKTVPQIRMTVTGEVEKVYSLTPRVVKLVGKIGEPIQETITLIPEDKFPFKIVGVRAKRGDFITYELDEFKKDDKTAYRMVITNTRKDKGRYFDKLLLTTDSKLIPEIKVGVFALIKDA